MNRDEALTIPRELFLVPALSLWRRETVRFLRQRSRVVGALGTPLVFWLLIGGGIGRSFQSPGTTETNVGSNYLQYSFPGTMALIVLFTSIFAMISVIEDRREGFMQAVVAAPVHRLAIVMGKILGSTTLAVGQALVFLLLAPLAGLPLSAGSFALSAGILVVVAVGLSGLGFVIAWPMDSTQGFHAVMNLFLIPMWLLSGALFPATGAAGWIAWLMRLNPLTYGVSAIRWGMLGAGGEAGAHGPSPAFSLMISAVFAVGMTIFAAVVVDRTRVR